MEGTRAEFYRQKLNLVREFLKATFALREAAQARNQEEVEKCLTRRQELMELIDDLDDKLESALPLSEEDPAVQEELVGLLQEAAAVDQGARRELEAWREKLGADLGSLRTSRKTARRYQGFSPAGVFLDLRK